MYLFGRRRGHVSKKKWVGGWLEAVSAVLKPWLCPVTLHRVLRVESLSQYWYCFTTAEHNWTKLNICSFSSCMSARKSVHNYNVFARLFSIFVVSFLPEPHTNTILTFLKHLNECDFVSVSEFNKYLQPHRKNEQCAHLRRWHSNLY